MDLLQTAANCLDQSLPGQIFFSFHQRAVKQNRPFYSQNPEKNEQNKKKVVGQVSGCINSPFPLKNKSPLRLGQTRQVFVLSELCGFKISSTGFVFCVSQNEGFSPNSHGFFSTKWKMFFGGSGGFNFHLDLFPRKKT